ncbi:MAG: hypothetical protein HND59_12825 [Pseudomonadota bacterium]|nr:MAG: hypothetical protein HND59_12825 [Pseudomonadota bacterium]
MGFLNALSHQIARPLQIIWDRFKIGKVAARQFFEREDAYIQLECRASLCTGAQPSRVH